MKRLIGLTAALALALIGAITTAPAALAGDDVGSCHVVYTQPDGGERTEVEVCT